MLHHNRKARTVLRPAGFLLLGIKFRRFSMFNFIIQFYPMQTVVKAVTTDCVASLNQTDKKSSSKPVNLKGNCYELFFNPIGIHPPSLAGLPHVKIHLLNPAAF